MQDKRESRRFAVTKPVLCSRFGKQMTMRTLDISRGGLKLEANFNLEVGESVDLTILTNGTRIRCKGKILAIEELGHKVQARLCFASPSDWEYGKLSDYLHSLSAGRKIPLPKWVTVGLYILAAVLAYLIIRTYFFE